MPQSVSMSTGWKRGAVGGRLVAIGAFQALAEAVGGGEAPAHLRRAAGGVEVERVREFEVAHLERMLGQRDPLQRRPLAGPADQHRGLNSGWARAKSEAPARRVSGSCAWRSL